MLYVEFNGFALFCDSALTCETQHYMEIFVVLLSLFMGAYTILLRSTIYYFHKKKSNDVLPYCTQIDQNYMEF